MIEKMAALPPSQELADELRRLHKSCVLKIYPPVGQTSDDGHNLLYVAVPQWEGDVFGFLDEHVKRQRDECQKRIIGVILD